MKTLVFEEKQLELLNHVVWLASRLVELQPRSAHENERREILRMLEAVDREALEAAAEALI